MYYRVLCLQFAYPLTLSVKHDSLPLPLSGPLSLYIYLYLHLYLCVWQWSNMVFVTRMIYDMIYSNWNQTEVILQ